MSEGGVLYGKKMCRKGESCMGGRCHVVRGSVVWKEDVMTKEGVLYGRKTSSGKGSVVCLVTVSVGKKIPAKEPVFSRHLLFNSCQHQTKY